MKRSKYKLNGHFKDRNSLYKSYSEQEWLALLIFHLTNQFDLFLNLERMNGDSWWMAATSACSNTTHRVRVSWQGAEPGSKPKQENKIPQSWGGPSRSLLAPHCHGLAWREVRSAFHQKLGWDWNQRGNACVKREQKVYLLLTYWLSAEKQSRHPSWWKWLEPREGVPQDFIMVRRGAKVRIPWLGRSVWLELLTVKEGGRSWALHHLAQMCQEEKLGLKPVDRRI